MANRRRKQTKPINYGAIFGALFLGIGILTMLYAFEILDISAITGK